MQEIIEQELLRQYAYQSWLDRGQPMGSPEVDWNFAKAQVGLHAKIEPIEKAPELLDVTDDA